MQFELDQQEDCDKFGGHMAFGEGAHTQQTQFAKIKDLDFSFIDVPFIDPKDKLAKLLANYREVTSCTKNIQNKPLYLKNPHKKRIYASQDYLIEDILPEIENGEVQITLQDPSTMPQQLPDSETQAFICIKGKNYNSQVNQGDIKVPMAKHPFSIIIKSQKAEIMDLQDCDPLFTVQMLKQRVKDRKKISRDMQILMFSGKRLQDHRRLKDYNIRQGSIIYLMKAYMPQPSKDEIYTINVKTIKGTFLKLFALPFDFVQSLKEKIKVSQNIPINDQKLIFGGCQLRNGRTLFQQNLVNQSTVCLVLQSNGGCFRKNCLVKVQKGKMVQISQLKKGDIIQSYNCQTQLTQEDVIVDIHSTSVTTAVKLNMENGQQIVCTPNHLFLNQNRHWMSVQYDQVNTRLQQDQILRTVHGTLRVIRITKLELEIPEEFYHISVQKNHTFIVNGLIAHNMQVFMIYKKTFFTLNIAPSQKISSFKKGLLDKKLISKIQLGQMELLYAGKVLENHKTWRDFNIPKDSYIELVSISEIRSDINKVDQVTDKTVILRFSETHSVKTSYLLISEMRVHQAISQFHSKPKQYYTFLYGNQILQPRAQIKSIEKTSNFNASQCTLILVKSYQKIAFNQLIPQNIAFQTQKYPLPPKVRKLKERAQKRVKQSISGKQYKNEAFYNPIQFYTCNSYFKAVNQYLNKGQFTDLKADVHNSSFAFTASLIKSLKMLPNYMGLVHRGMNNFKFSSFYKQGNSFYWKSFTSTSLNEEVARKFNKIKGTLYHIYSVTGKQIGMFSVYQDERQVVFLPFTYFFVQKIMRNEDFDQVWLTQMPTPVDLKRNLILWVDDQPTNNLKYIEKMRQKADILALTSTAMAKCWMQEFGWLTNWIGIKTRFISDMVRIERDIPNYQAGIDLLQQFYSIGGLTTPIMIFCKDKQKANQTIQKRNIGHQGYFKVTTSPKQVVQFSNFQVKLEGERKQNVYQSIEKYNQSQKCYNGCQIM